MQSSAPSAGTADAHSIFKGDGNLSGQLRTLDWDSTALGPLEAWPPALRALAALVTASGQPMALLWGPDLTPIYNDACRALLSDLFLGAVGQPARDTWPQAWLAEAAQVIATGQAATLHIVRQSTDQAVDVTLAISPACDERGAVCGVILMAPRTAPSAMASEERLRVALEAAELGTWDLDLTTDTSAVRSLRHDQIFGYEELQEIWGREVATRHVLEEDRHMFEGAFVEAMATGVLSCEVRVRWPDGSTRWIAPRGRTYYDAQGRPVRMAGVVADVTERNSAQALRQSEARFRLMADAVPQIVWITDANGRVEFFNQQWRNYTGLAFDPETAAQVAAATVHPDDGAITMERFEQARAGETTFLVEHRIRDAAGNYRWFLVRAEPYRDPLTGEVSRWFGASVDIHDRKLAEEDLRALTCRQQFQIALADRIRPLSDPDQVTAAATQMLGRHLGADRVIYGEVGKSGERIVSKQGWTAGTLATMDGMVFTLDDFGPSAANELRAGRVLSVADVASDPVAAAYASAYAATGIRAVLAIPLMKNDQLRAVMGIHASCIRRWSDNDVAMARDMVDRVWSAVESARAQTKLRIERDRSQSVFDGMTEGFALFSRNWTVLEMNAAALRIAQRARADILGKNHWDVWPVAIGAGAGAGAMYRAVMATREPDSLEYYQVFGNGQSAWIEVAAYPAGADDLAVFFRDITERKQTEQTLKDADRRKDEFLAMLAHELRNPLAPIGAAAQLLQIAKLDEARVRSTSQIIGRQVNHMTHLIDDLLDVSRVTRGLVELESAALDIGVIVADAVEQVTPLIRARGHQLALHLPPAPDAIMVLGDKKRLVQVVANILTNAAKYTNEGGQISLKTDVHDAHVLITVTDNGIGMTADLAAQAFELFAQAERSSDRSAGGLGLGLALVKNLVELHHGKVTCHSAGPGTGSTFTVCLPRLEGAPRRNQEREDDLAIAQVAVPLRVMVVDDNVDAADMLAMLLQAAGHQVAVENDAAAALARARAEQPDICLLDIGLPDMDGYELAQRLRATPDAAGPLLIAITGYGQESDRQRTAAAGFDYHLVKPVDTNALASIIAGFKTGLKPS